MRASRSLEGSRWRADLIALSDSGDEVGEWLGRRAVDGSWSITTKVTFEEGAEPSRHASFFLDARSHEVGVGDIICSVGSNLGQPAGGDSMCAQGFHALLLRRRDEGTLVVRYLVYYGARDNPLASAFGPD